MLKIRDFAKLAEVSLTTLRYYDEIGLLKPIHVDPVTGYRLYTVDQLPYLHRILAFKELGHGLTEIARILDEGVSSEAFQGMLRLRQAQLQQQIKLEQEQLDRIEARLRALEPETYLPVYEVVVKAIKPICGVSLRLSADDLSYHAHWTDAMDTIFKPYRIRPIDPLMVVQSMGEDEQTPGSVEVIAPVTRQDADTVIACREGRLTHCELPAIPHMASVIYQGHPALVMPAYQALGTWIESNGYTITGSRRKIRLRRGEDLNDSLTEIQFPVEKTA